VSLSIARRKRLRRKGFVQQLGLKSGMKDWAVMVRAKLMTVMRWYEWTGWYW